MEPLIIVAFVVLMIVFSVFGIYASYKRKKELAAFAAAHNLIFSPDRDSSFDDRYPEFSCLREGSNRYASNHLTGEWKGLDFHGFEYHYETYSTDSKGHRQTHHHRFSAVILRGPVPLEPLFIRPEGFFDKITEFFGMDDIDFESAEFSRKFFVKANNKKWAYDVLHPRAMEFLLSSPKYHIQFNSTHAIAWNSSVFQPDQYGTAADVVCGLWERMPEYLLIQQREKYGEKEFAS